MKKRVLFASLAAYPLFNRKIHEPFCGAELDLYTIATHLDTSKFDVHFLVADYGQPLKETYSGITVHRGQKISNSGMLRGILNFLRIFLVVWRVRPDSIFSEATGWLTVELILLKTLFRKKFIFRSAHENNINGFTDTRPYGKLYRRFMPRIDHFLLQNNQDISILQSTFGYTGKMSVVRNLQEIPKDIPLPQEKRAHILWVGRSEKIKDPELFLKLSLLLPQKKFVMIMPNLNENVFRDIASKARAIPNLTFIPGVPRDAVLPYFKEALYFVSTSIKEGFPNVLVEAMKYGTPILSARLDYDNILSEKNCGTITGDSAEEIASCIESMSKDTWETYSQNARAFALNNFNVSKGIHDYERLFLQI